VNRRNGAEAPGGATVLLVVVALAMTGVLGLVVAAAALGAAPVGSNGCGPAGTAQRVAGVTVDAEQLGNAATIVDVVARRRLPAHAAVIAVATAYQESRLRNLTYGDAAGPDSAGLFQQRPSAGWGTRAQVLNPVYATGAFVDRLVTVPGWAGIPLTQAAQAVQNSALPTAYARWEGLATGVVAQLWPAAAAARDSDPAVCPEAGGAGGARAGGTTRLPGGFEITGSRAGQVAVRYALAQLGKPYRWGAAGPDAFDCSGLTMTAWAAAGLALPHFTGDQVHAGTPEPLDLSHAAGGDLVFIPGSDGTPREPGAVPGHVGMIAGRAPAVAGQPQRLYVIQAPQTGRPVMLTPVSAWAGQIVAVRHLV
jgi:peptidoglycan DL-endopeptidase CwlO